MASSNTYIHLRKMLLFLNLTKQGKRYRARCAVGLAGDVVSRDAFGLGRVGALGYRAHSSL